MNSLAPQFTGDPLSGYILLATDSRRKIETEKLRETEKGTQAKGLTERQRDKK